jgi:hypothetical protein
MSSDLQDLFARTMAANESYRSRLPANHHQRSALTPQVVHSSTRPKSTPRHNPSASGFQHNASLFTKPSLHLPELIILFSYANFLSSKMHSIKHSLTKIFHHGQNHDHINLQVHQRNASSPHPPTALDIIRYRFHYGVNLGSVYVLEKWLFSSAFPASCLDGQTSELEAVKAWAKDIGVEQTRSKFETRWRAIIGDIDWDWLVNKGHGS